MVKVIEIEDCWMIKEYNKHNSDKNSAIGDI